MLYYSILKYYILIWFIIIIFQKKKNQAKSVFWRTWFISACGARQESQARFQLSFQFIKNDLILIFKFCFWNSLSTQNLIQKT